MFLRRRGPIDKKMKKSDDQKTAAAKKILYGAVLFLLAVLFFEVISFAALMIAGRSLTPLSLSQAERKQIREYKVPDNIKEAFLPEWIQSDRMHPYLGFVLPSEPNDPFGFGNEISPVQKRDPKRVIVAITGGSVAYLLHRFALNVLREELLKIPELSDKEIVFIRLAAGGFKQPQQLMTLNYLISLGGEFDLVINFDGFNEVALPEPDNVSRKIFPLYPRGWSFRIGAISIPSVRYAMETGLLTQKVRVNTADFFSRPAVNNSAACNLIWKVLDHAFQFLIRRTNHLINNYQLKSSNDEVSGPFLNFNGETELYQYLAMNWARSSVLMSQICQANNIRYFHFLQPNQYFPGSKRLTQEEKEKAYKEDHPYRKGVLIGYPAMRSLAGDVLGEINFYDLTMLFSEENRTVYADDCCHYNATGYEISAREIGRIIRQNFGSALLNDPQEKSNERV